MFTLVFLYLFQLIFICCVKHNFSKKRNSLELPQNKVIAAIVAAEATTATLIYSLERAVQVGAGVVRSAKSAGQAALDLPKSALPVKKLYFLEDPSALYAPDPIDTGTNVTMRYLVTVGSQALPRVRERDVILGSAPVASCPRAPYALHVRRG